MSRYQTSTSRFFLVNGNQQLRAEPVLVAEAVFGQEARKGQLYIVAECDDQARGGDACQLAVKTIERVFYEDSSFSVTSALRKAVLRANRVLYDRNFSTSAAQRSYVGVVCAVLKGNDLYIAQVAPSQAYLSTRGAVRPLPPHPSWNPAYLSPTPFVKPAAMGTSLFVEPEFFRGTLQVGDGFLLCSSNLSRVLSRDAVKQVLASETAHAAVEALLEDCSRNAIPTAQGLVVVLQLPGTAGANVERTGLSARAVWLMRSLLAWGSSLGGEAAARMRRYKSSLPAPTPPAAPPAEPPLANPLPRPRPIELGPNLEERRQEQRSGLTGPFGLQEAALPPSTFLGEGNYVPNPPPDRTLDLSHTQGMGFRSSVRIQDEVKPLVDMTLSERLALPFQRLFGAFERTAGRRRRFAPPGLPVARGQGLSYRRQRPPFPWQVLLFLIILVAALVFYGYNISQQNAIQQAQSNLTEAEQAVAAVYSAPDEAAALQRLDLAQQTIDQLQASSPLTESNTADWLRFQQIQRELARAQSSLLRISVLEGVELVADHPSAGGLFARVIVPSGEVSNTADLAYIYAFDEQAKTLYRIPYDGGEAAPVLRSGDQVQSVIVGDLVLAAWRTDSVVAIDRSAGSNFYFRSGDGWLYSVLAGSEEWPRDSQIDMEIYQGNLYFWNAIKGQILKYVAGNYGNPATPWIVDSGGRDIEQSVDMAIDGNIYLLQPDLRILVFEGGIMVREIVPENVSPPLSLVSRFIVSGPPDGGSIIMVDTLNERIVQLDKQSGKLIQQLRLAADSNLRLDQLSDVYLDERSSRPLIYIINGAQVLRVPLPPPPQPFRPQEAPTQTP